MRDLLQAYEREERVRIIAVTGHVENEYVERALECGMDKVFSKPLQSKDLGEELVNLGIIDRIPQRVQGQR